MRDAVMDDLMRVNKQKLDLECEVARLTAELEAAKADANAWSKAGLCLRCGMLVSQKEIAAGKHGECEGPMRRFVEVMDAVKWEATRMLMEADGKSGRAVDGTGVTHWRELPVAPGEREE